jgi:putative transposase
MIPLEPTHYFHVFNRANGFEKVFLSPGNYIFFMEKYRKYVVPYVHTYCYCLMPNHFHFLIQIKSIDEISDWINKSEPAQTRARELEKFHSDPEKYISKRLSNLFSSYTQAFNKLNHRMGSLFMKNFKRKPIRDESYLKNLVHYIHYNPIEARLCEHPEEWMHSSYGRIIRSDSTLVKADDVVEWFDNLENFKAFHSAPPMLDDTDD